MKVIAMTKAGYLLEATADEVANICGYYSEISPEFDPTLEIGDEVKVSEIFSQYKALLGKKASLESALTDATEAKAKLETSIQTLESLESPVVKSV